MRVLTVTAKSFWVKLTRPQEDKFDRTQFKTHESNLKEIAGPHTGYVFDLDYKNQCDYGVWFSVCGDTEQDIDALSNKVFDYIKTKIR
jgi:hypothetical protein